MSGRHEPPSKRSFYLSLATSTLRFAIIVALIVGGVVVINSAFSEPSGGTVSDGGGPIVTSSPTPSPTPSKSPKPTQSPQLVDMPIAVRNGTAVSGLASQTAKQLETKYGVQAIQVDDAPSPVAVTTIYYRSADSQDEAEYLAQKFFKQIEPQVLKLEGGSGVDKDVEIAIYLGTDYANAQA